MNGDLVFNIKRICAKNGISLRQMEEDLKFSPGLVSRWARMSPSIDKIIAVAEYLGVSIDVLVGRENGEDTLLLINTLYERTVENEIEWIPCGFENPFYYPIHKLKELQRPNWSCAYCEFENGYFMLAYNVDNEDKPVEIGLYIFADADAVPVCWYSDIVELMPLCSIIQENIKWIQDKSEVLKLVERFIKAK